MSTIAEVSVAVPTFDEELIQAALLVDHHLNHGRPITSDEMESSLAQYKREWQRHLARGATESFVPSTLDVDRVWHAHMCVPQQYAQDCIEYFGFMLEHSAPRCVCELIK